MNKILNYSKKQTIELINLTAEQLSLQEPAVVEKDLYVTKAIHALVQINNPHFKLIFQGGTALVKAHRLINRMSEDCDFRIIYKEQPKSRDQQRKLLRAYTDTLIKVLEKHNFDIDKDTILVRNEGQFISIRARYTSSHKLPSNLKPFIALELFLGSIKTPTISKEVTTLIRQTLGEKILHPSLPTDCMSIIETAAEKWVALTRRTATANDKYYKHSLVRHIYDLHLINSHTPLDNLFEELIPLVVSNDQSHFKHQDMLFSESPLTVIKQSLKNIYTNPIWQENWQIFMSTMVYGSKPSFNEALDSLKLISNKALSKLQRI